MVLVAGRLGRFPTPPFQIQFEGSGDDLHYITFLSVVDISPHYSNLTSCGR